MTKVENSREKMDMEKKGGNIKCQSTRETEAGRRKTVRGEPEHCCESLLLSKKTRQIKTHFSKRKIMKTNNEIIFSYNKTFICKYLKDRK